MPPNSSMNYGIRKQNLTQYLIGFTTAAMQLPLDNGAALITKITNLITRSKR